MKTTRQFGMLTLATMLSLPMFGYQRPQPAQGKSNNDRAQQNKNSNSGSNVRFQGPRTGDWLRKNMNTPPAQQKQELESDDNFKKLPPQQQQQLINRLNRFNAMSPQQKNRMISHIDWLNSLTPEQKQKANSLHDQFHALSPDRRQAVRRALFGMRDMSPDDRQKNIDSPQMKQQYSDQERQIIKGYTDLGFPDQHAEEGGGSPQEEM